MIRPTIVIALTLAGVACALTLVYLAMRAVMDVGGFCASGGPYEIRQECPQGVPAVMIAGIWGGIVLALVYVWQVLKHHVPSFAGLLWPALFLSLGWNFLEYAFDAPAGDDVVWGWLVCGVVFVLMGGLPLLAVLPATVRSFTRGDGRPPPGFPGGIPVAHVQRVTDRVSGAGTRADARVVDELERLAALHERGAITSEEYEQAKRSVLGGSAS